MCYPATCKVCGKTTWSGCGQHIADVRRNVSAPQWCAGEHTSAEISAAASESGFFGRLFRKR